MPSLFSRLKGKDGPTKLKSKKNGAGLDFASQVPEKPRWVDAYTRTTVEPEEIHELLKLCTAELKARGKLPSRPSLHLYLEIASRSFADHSLF